MNGSAEKTLRLLVLWPRYEPGKKDFFRIFLDNFDATLVFVGSGAKGKEINSGAEGRKIGDVSEVAVDGLAPFIKEGRIVFWNFPGFRASDFYPSEAALLWKRIYNLVKDGQWDFVMFSTQSPLHSKFAYLNCRLRKIRCGAKIEVWENFRSNNLLMWAYKYLDKIIMRGVDATFPHGRRAQAYCMRTANAVPSIIMPYIMEDPGERDYGLSLNKLVYCGALTATKNVYDVLGAFLSSAVLRGRSRLVIAGDGPMLPDLQKRVAKEGAQSVVEFIGAYDRESLPGILDSESVFVLASRNDGWSYATLEAVSLGRPLILSDRVGAAHDLLEEGENGFLVPVNNIAALRSAMEKMVFVSPERAMRMQRASRRIFQEHNKPERVVSAIQSAAEFRGIAHAGIG